MTSIRAAAVSFVLLVLAAGPLQAAGHRDAPLTALDRPADIADVFVFRSLELGPPRVTMIMTVDPFLEPATGSLGAPFDPEILYAFHVDNDQDAVADLSITVRFATEIRSAASASGIFGVGTGIAAPANSPPPIAPGTPILPPRIATMDAAGLGLRQSYVVTVVQGRKKTVLAPGVPLFAVPANLGPRTVSANDLFAANIYALGGGVRAFAGTVDDPFFADAGGLGDTLNLRAGVATVLTPTQDASTANAAPDTFAGYAVNAIAIEVPVEMLTATGAVEPASAPAATIGVWATTSRFPSTKRPPPKKPPKNPKFKQVQRMANPFVNDWLIGLASKDAFSRSVPEKDAAFAPFLFDPEPARIWNALTAGAVPIPTPPRTDLAIVFGYAEPVAAPGTPPGPTADLLHLNTGTPPAVPGLSSRLGVIGGDPAGFPNGRRVGDDVTDVMLRIVNGVFAAGFNAFPNNRLGDGVNVDDRIVPSTFPYLAVAPSGRDRRHLDPGEPGCTGGGGAACAP